MSFLVKLRQKGLPFLNSCQETVLVETLRDWNNQYHNYQQTSSSSSPSSSSSSSDAIVTDSEYDLVRQYFQSKFPQNPFLSEIGAPSYSEQKIKLPCSLPSLDKIKPDTNALTLWISKYPPPYVVSEKLDGISALFCSSSSSLYTRGDGLIGQNISLLLEYIQGIPSKVPLGLRVRGEIIISKQEWQMGLFHKQFANPRNMVSGLVNRKTFSEDALQGVSRLDFVAYELIYPGIPPSKQLDLLKSYGFLVVPHITLSQLSNQDLSLKLQKHRSESKYEIDGLVVTHDAVYERPTECRNPDHAFAFKMILEEQQAEAVVVDVLWTASKDGYLKPRVQIEPVQLCGVRIEYATGFHARFIQDNGIGVGAIIIMERSGDVIPTIRRVVKPAAQPKMPQEWLNGKAQWSDHGIDLILLNPSEDNDVQKKRITVFFRALKIDGLSEGNVVRLMEAGFQTISAIVHMKKEDYLRVKGFQERMADKLAKNVAEGIANASWVDMMIASGIFGRGLGTQKLQSIVKVCGPQDWTKASTACLEWITRINNDTIGIGWNTAKDFVDHLDDFLQFCREIDYNGPSQPIVTIQQKNQINQTAGIYTGKQVVLTKVEPREKSLIIKQRIENQGGIISDNISKSTHLLIYGSLESTKCKKAKEWNIPMMDADQFLLLSNYNP